jgi:hypothetical protein
MPPVARTCSPLPNSPLRSTALPISAFAPVPVDQQGNAEETEAVPSTRAAIVEHGRVRRVERKSPGSKGLPGLSQILSHSVFKALRATTAEGGAP